MIILVFLILIIYAYLTIALLIRLFYKGRQYKIQKSSGKFSNPFYFRPQKPVSWFDLFGLLNTFAKISNSTKTLAIIDKREVEASFRPDNPNLFNIEHENVKASGLKNDEFWFDFIADTGDGFDSTTSVFYALTRDSLSIGDKDLQRGKMLIVGGDLVYPEGSEESYSDRFKAPIRTVFPSGTSSETTYLVSTPGNHDWYDGLSSYLRLMCQQKKIGNYTTVQNRSYFAYSVFNNVHILGLDNQLLGDLDIPQVNYFSDFASKLPQGENIKHSFILIVAEPYWYGYSFNDRHKRRQRMDSMEYIIDTVKRALPTNPNVEFRVVMTGDIHHYARYANKNEMTLITSGGGGAFKHMTSKLESSITIPDLNKRTPPIAADNYQLKNKSFDDCTSKWHAAKNLLFPILNPRFTGLVFTLFALIALSLGVYSIGAQNMSWWQKIILSSAVPLFFGLILKSVESPESSTKTKATFYASAFSLLSMTFYLNFNLLQISYENCIQCELNKYFSECNWIQSHDWIHFLAFIAKCAFIALSNTLLFGIYLYIQYQFLGRNLTEASSSNVIQGYNHFIRCKINKEFLEFYVIGLKKAYPWTKYVKNMNNNPNFNLDATKTDVPFDTFLTSAFKEYEHSDFELIETFNVRL